MQHKLCMQSAKRHFIERVYTT